MANSSKKEKALAEFRKIPGVGKAISEDFWDIGLRSIDDLREKDPQELYDQLCQHQKCQVDRCMLYVFRCAVYFATEKKHKPALLKWWNWKD